MKIKVVAGSAIEKVFSDIPLSWQLPLPALLTLVFQLVPM